MQCNSMNLLHTNANVSMGELVQIYEFFMALFSYFLKIFFVMLKFMLVLGRDLQFQFLPTYRHLCSVLELNDFEICFLSPGLHLMLTEASLKWCLGHIHSPKMNIHFSRYLIRQMFVHRLGRMNIPNVTGACKCQVLKGESAAGNFTFRTGAAVYTQYLEFSCMSHLSTTNITATP